MAAAIAAADAVRAAASSLVAMARDTAPVVTMPRHVQTNAALSHNAQAGPSTASSDVARSAPTDAVSTRDRSGDESQTSRSGSVKALSSETMEGPSPSATSVTRLLSTVFAGASAFFSSGASTLRKSKMSS